MQAWEEIGDVMAWFISKWQDKIYNSWAMKDKNNG